MAAENTWKKNYNEPILFFCLPAGYQRGHRAGWGHARHDNSGKEGSCALSISPPRHCLSSKPGHSAQSQRFFHVGNTLRIGRGATLQPVSKVFLLLLSELIFVSLHPRPTASDPEQPPLAGVTGVREALVPQAPSSVASEGLGATGA